MGDFLREAVNDSEGQFSRNDYPPTLSFKKLRGVKGNGVWIKGWWWKRFLQRPLDVIRHLRRASNDGARRKQDSLLGSPVKAIEELEGPPSLHNVYWRHIYDKKGFDVMNKTPGTHACLKHGYWCWENVWERPLDVILYLKKKIKHWTKVL